MKNEKDIQKTYINSYDQASFSGDKSLSNNVIYDFTNKKTEKLVTALYMVTDCMETEDALKEKLRLLGVELLSHNHKLSTLIPTEKHVHIATSLNHIHEILSFIEVANTIGYISDMNTGILKKEFHILIGELHNHLPKEKHFPFTLDENMFKLSPNISRTEKLSFTESLVKRTNNMSFTNLSDNKAGNKTNNSHVLYKPSPSLDYKKVKSDRVEKIISIIKDKVTASNGGASIKDISASFIDCSEKTIQRELNDLIEKGQIKKMGDKRWSRYSLVESSK